MDYLIRFEVTAIAAGGGVAGVAMRVHRQQDDKNVVYTMHSLSSGGLVVSSFYTDWINVPAGTASLPVMSSEKALLGGYTLSLEIMRNVMSLSGGWNDVQVILDGPATGDGPPTRIFDISQQVKCTGFAVGGFKMDGQLYGGFLRGSSISEPL